MLAKSSKLKINYNKFCVGVKDFLTERARGHCNENSYKFFFLLFLLLELLVDIVKLMIIN